MTDYDTIMTHLKNKYGGNRFTSGIDKDHVYRIPTGSHALDYAMSGGVPVGMWTRFYGSYGTGKTFTCFNIMRNAQNIESFARTDEELQEIRHLFPDGIKIHYYDTEQRFDRERAEAVGVDTSKVEVITIDVIEALGEILENTMESINLHIIDSASSAIPLKELTMEVEEERRGGSAKSWGKAIRRTNHFMNKEIKNIGIIVDQVRIDQTNNTEMAPGGKFLEHAVTSQIKFKKGSWLYKDGDGYLTDDQQKIASLSGMKEAEGLQIDARVEKNGVGISHRTAKMWIDLSGSKYDVDAELANAAIHFGLVEKKGSWFHLMHEDGTNGTKVQGTRKLRQEIAGDRDFRDRILQTWKTYY